MHKNISDLPTNIHAHSGNILLLEFYLFSHCKACDANITFIENFGYFVTNSNEKTGKNYSFQINISLIYRQLWITAKSMADSSVD